MDKKITLNKLLSYVASISVSNGPNADSKNNDTNDTTNSNENNNYNLSSFKNDLVESSFKILKFGEVNTLGDLPKKLKKIFDPFISDMKRVGVLTNKNKVTNVSLLYSLLYCIKTNFLDLSNAEKITCIEQLNSKMVTDLYSKELFKLYNYESLGWTIKELYETIYNYKNNILSLRFLSDYFNINIFLFNINEDKIYAIYPEEKYNVFKPSMLLSFFDNIFEPIIYKQHDKIWRNDHEPLKKLINVDKKFIGVIDMNFSKKDPNKVLENVFSIGSDDLTRYLPTDTDAKNTTIVKDDENVPEKVVPENNKLEVEVDNKFDEVYVKDKNTEVYIDDPEETELDIETAKNDQDIFCVKNDNDSDNLETIETISLKLPLDKLQRLATKLNISIDKGKFRNGNVKLKTKKELYEDLLLTIKQKK